MSEFPELKSYQKRITTSSYKLPPILSFQSYQDQKTCESRLQTFRFERGNMKKRQIPKKLFSKSLVLDQHFQFHIIDEELKIFFEKLKTLKSKLTLKSYADLFKTISEQNKQIFNSKLEETLALSEVIYGIILSKFEQDLQEAGIAAYPYLHRNHVVRDEVDTLGLNCSYLALAINAFKGAIAAYRTLAKKKEAKPLEYFELNELFSYLAQARLNISELLDEMTFNEKFINEKYKMSENTLNLHSVAEILNVPPEVIEKLKKNSVNDYKEIKDLTPKASSEVIEGIFNTRKYLSSLESSASHAKSSIYLRIMSHYSKTTSQDHHYASEGFSKTDRPERSLSSLNDPKLYSNISNVYGSNPSLKLLSSERLPRPTNKVRYFPDLGLKKAVKLGEIVTKSINNY